MSDERKNLALVGLSTLENIGIKELIHREWRGRIQSFSSMENFSEIKDHFSAFIVSSETFISNLDYFIPRRQKVLVLLNTPNHREIIGEGIINPYSDESEIKQCLKAIFDLIDEKHQEYGELSVREKEVLRLVAAGKINKEIADELCISINTVITHRKNLTAKLGVKSASALTTYAIMNGLI